MHKVVLEAPGESELLKVSEKLKENGVDFKLWIEQPENFPTCLAVKPYPKEVSKSFSSNGLNLLFTILFILGSSEAFQKIQTLQRTWVETGGEIVNIIENVIKKLWY